MNILQFILGISKPPHHLSHIFQAQNNSLFQFRGSDVGTTFFIIHRLFSPSACVDDPLLLFHFAVIILFIITHVYIFFKAGKAIKDAFPR